MKTLTLLIALLFSLGAFSREVNVRGYLRSNGTYVQPHVRTAPDSTRSNNYGRPSSYSNYQEVHHPETRDYDHDGIPNINDMDDNNNGVLDDNENN